MGLFTKTRTYTYVVYSPVMGDSYNTTVKYGNRKEKVPLDVITTREMLALHGQGLNNSSKMKVQLKYLRDIHNLPFLKKTGEFGTQRIDTKTIDFTKLETMYSSTIQDISTDIFSDLAYEYIYKVSNGKYSSIYDLEDIIVENVIPKIDTNPSRPYVKELKIRVLKLYDIFISYLGNNTFNVRAKALVEKSYLWGIEERWFVETDWYTLNVTLPEEFKFLWEIANNDNVYIIKFANGNMIHLDSNSLPNFQKQGDSKIEFSVPIGLKFKYISYSPKDAKKMELARTKLGYQEYKNKKRNRQELLYELIQNNKDIDHDCRINMYLDLYPFKDPKYRADKNWQLFLKGVMRYFSRITGIANIDEGKGFTSVSLPPYFLTSDKTFRYMNIEIIKEKVSGPDLSKSTPYCFFEKGKARNLNFFGLAGLAIGLGSITENTKENFAKSFNTMWLCLIVDMGNNKFIKYKLNYSRFYEGLSGVNSSDKIVISTEIISNINKKLNRSLRDKYNPDTGQIEIPEIKEEVSQSEEDKALAMLGSKLRNAFWYDDKDISMAKWDKESKQMKDKIPTGAPENGLSAFDLPKLPMPILMWNMIPYNGKKVAYTSTLLINFILNIKVKESTGLGAFLVGVVTIVVTVITWNPGAGVKAGAATSSALIGVASVTAAKVIITVGAWASAIGSISGNKFLSRVGMAIGLWAGVSGIVNGLNGGFSSLSTLDMLKGVNFVIDVANNLRGLDMEKKLQSMADELKNGQREFEYEKDNRKDIWGGVAKTNAAADEEIDQMMELTLQEGLFEVLISHIDIEKNSAVFNDMKYDNTR